MQAKIRSISSEARYSHYDEFSTQDRMITTRWSWRSISERKSNTNFKRYLLDPDPRARSP